MFGPSTPLEKFSKNNKEVALLFKKIAIDAEYKSGKNESDTVLASAFVLFRFDNPYEYTPRTLVEVLGILTSPEGHRHQIAVHNLANSASDRDFSILIPERIAELGLDFLHRVLHEVRAVICKKERGRLIAGRRSIPAIVSGLASSLTASLGIPSAMATGVAATILVVVAQAAHKSFCDMTDEQVLTAVAERTAMKRARSRVQKS